MIDPLVAMKAACIAIAEGEANEIELEFADRSDNPTGSGETEERLTIYVRRTVKHFYATPPTEEQP